MSAIFKHAAIGLSTFALAQVASATIYVNQTFDTDGGPNLTYYPASGATTMSTTTDPLLNTTTVESFSTTSTPRFLSSDFTAPATLTNVGDTLTYSFAFRIASLPVGATYTPQFRFGIYNSNGTPTTTGWSGGAAQANNDLGYSAQIALNATPTIKVTSEASYTGMLCQDFSDADTTIKNTITPPAFSINNTNAHTIAMILTRTATGVTIALTLDGATLFTGIDTSANIVTGFTDIQFGIFDNWNDPYELHFDNVKVETAATPVPEASSLGLLSLCALAGLLAKRAR